MEDSESSDEIDVESDLKENDVEEPESIHLAENLNETVVDNNKASTFDFTEKSWRTDLVLIVEGTRLYVAKNILSLASPVFDRMFQSKIKESSSGELELPGKKVEDIKEFLRCVYPNTLAQISYDNALKVLPLLEEYQVFQLKPRCESVLCEHVNEQTSIEELFLLMNEACTFNLEVLRKKCVSFALNLPYETLDEAISKCSSATEAVIELLRKMNTKNRNRIKELEESNAMKSKEIEIVKQKAENDAKILEEAKAEMVEELALLKQCLSSEIKRSKEGKFDVDSNWQGRQIVLSIDSTVKVVKAEKIVTVWDVPLVVSAIIADNWLNLVIENKENQVECDFKVCCVLVNRQPRGSNYTERMEEKFSLWRQKIIKKIEEYYTVKNISNGFMVDGRFGLIVQLYMSEPNKM